MLFAISYILILFVLITCLFTFVKGGPAERVGAVVILANLLAGVLNEAQLHDQLITLAIDGLTALALLVVAVRYASFWLGGVMLLYALQFGLDAYYLVLEQPRDNLHVILNNIDFFAVSLCLSTGTALAWRRRVRLASAEDAPAA
jgi:hypothetical protein